MSGDDIPFLKADRIQLVNRIITNGMAEISASYQSMVKSHGVQTLLKSGWPGPWEEVGGGQKGTVTISVWVLTAVEEADCAVKVEGLGTKHWFGMWNWESREG